MKTTHLLVASAALAAASAAHAQPLTVNVPQIDLPARQFSPPFPSQPFSVSAVDVTSQLAGRGSDLTTYTVSLDWTQNPPNQFNAVQFDATFALTNQPALSSTGQSTGATFFADPGSALNAATLSPARFQPGRLEWAGILGGGAIPDGGPLIFNAVQFGAFAATRWTTITVTFDSPSISSGTFSGDTTNRPTYTRPRDGRFDTISGANTNIRHDVIPVFVDVAGVYEFRTVTGGTPYNGMLSLYADAFDPTRPLDNLVVFDGLDTSRPGGTAADSLLGVTLDADRQYVLVQGGAIASSFGPYTGAWRGAGNVTFGIVPEPTTTLALVVPAVLLTLRRRR